MPVLCNLFYAFFISDLVLLFIIIMCEFLLGLLFDFLFCFALGEIVLFVLEIIGKYMVKRTWVVVFVFYYKYIFILLH